MQPGAIQPWSDELTLLSPETGGEAGTRGEAGMPGASTLMSVDTSEATTAPVPLASQERYTDLGLLGEGGMGQVRRVRDALLGRIVAMKLLRPDRQAPAFDERFVAEAQLLAQLQHPGVVPIYDHGTLPDGRRYLTMREVHGATLGAAIAAVHAASGPERWGVDADGLSLHRLIDAFAAVCRTVAYAHERGVLHRDIKPSNVMLGERGEVLVLDWGLARVVEEAADEPVSVDAATSVAGVVVGTPCYMPPEQARGLPLDARADIYALGATLYEILYGRPPHRGRSLAVLAAIMDGEGPEFSGEGPPPPPELVALCRAAMASDRDARPASADALARAALHWLDGVGRRAEALALVAQAEAQRARAVACRQHAEALRAEAGALLAGVKLWEPEARKAPGWALEDEAARVESEALGLDEEADLTLHTALNRDPGLEEAHEALAARFQAQYVAADEARDPAGRRRAELHLRAHAEALPLARRGALQAWLRGDGALTLHTDPAGAEVWLERYVVRNRRLVPELVGPIGRTPLDDLPLAQGSYRLRLRAEGHQEVHYPVSIGRQERWDGVPPGGAEPHAVHLPRAGELQADERYVPAGWAWMGGDPHAKSSLPRRRVWVDDLVIQRSPVTNRDYIVFLDDLLEQGREEEALDLAPRENAGVAGTVGLLYYGRDQRGRFVLAPDAQGDAWLPDYPVVMIHWGAAVAYGAWLAERTGLPWRLPGELEWEKAARGVDGRYYPWGDWLDPSWSCVLESHRIRPLPATVETFPVDESVYGARDLAGNTREWCGDLYQPDGPELVDGRVVPPCPPMRPDMSNELRRSLRGGLWGGLAHYARSATRSGAEPASRSVYVGFRLARSLP